MKNKGCIYSLVTILVLATIGLGYYFSSSADNNAQALKIEKPEKRDIIKKSVASGSVKPRQEVNIKPQVSGVIDALFVEEGDLVTKGQQIARIKLVPSEVNINNAQSSVTLARLRFQDAERELTRQQEVFEKSLDLKAAQANYDNALQEEKRYKDLFEEGVISQQEYNRYLLNLEVQKNTLENARIGRQNSLRQFENNLSIRKQELDAAVNNLQLLKEGASNNSRQVANIVTSTLEGMVLELPVKEGSSVIERNNFNEGTTIAVIANMNELVFEGKVDEADVGKLQTGMPLQIKVGAINDALFEAALEFISPKGVEENGTIKFDVRAALSQSEEEAVFLRAGYSANADIIIDRKIQVLSIAERDLLFEDNATFVELVLPDKSLQKKKIETGLSDGVYIEIAEGLDSSAMIKVREKN